MELLPASALRWRCDPDQFEFETTAQFQEVVVDDGSTSSALVIDAARRLTITAGSHHLVIMATPDAARFFQTEQGSVAGRNVAEAVIRVTSTEQLISQIRRLRPTVMLLGRDQNLAADSQWHRKLALIRCPLALVQPTW